MKLKALLVDLDGTLINSLPALFATYLEFLHSFGHKGTEKEFNGLNGYKINEIVSILKQKYALHYDELYLNNLYSQFLKKNYVSDVEIFPGAVECLQEAKDQGLKIALVTSAHSLLVKKILERLHLHSFFTILITGDSVKNSKPNPEIYLKAIEQLQIHAENALAFEDSPHGINSAENAGIKTVLFKQNASKPQVEEGRLIANWFGLKKKLWGEYGSLSDVESNG